MLCHGIYLERKKHSQFIWSSQFLCSIHLALFWYFILPQLKSIIWCESALVLQKSIKSNWSWIVLRRHVGHAILSVALSSKHSNEMERRSEKKMVNAILFNSFNHACVLSIVLVVYYFNGMRDGKLWYYRYQIQTHPLVLHAAHGYQSKVIVICIVCVLLIRNFGFSTSTTAAHMHLIHNLMKATATMINEGKSLRIITQNSVFACHRTHTHPIGYCVLFIALPFTPFIRYCFDLERAKHQSIWNLIQAEILVLGYAIEIANVLPAHTGTIGLAFIVNIAWYSYSQIVFIISVLRVVCFFFHDRRFEVTTC